MPGRAMSEEEQRLVKEWYVQDSIAPSEIASRLKRDKSTITRFLNMRKPRKKLGRTAKLTEAQIDALESKLTELIDKAAGEYEVSMSMLKRSARVKASVRTMSRALHARNIYFRPMRAKPVLTEQDVKDRKAFGKKYVKKRSSWWSTQLHMIIDVKFYPVYLRRAARRHAAQKGSRGTYRKPGQGLAGGHVKPNPKLKYNTGAKGVQVLAGVGHGRVLLWEYIEGRWNGAAAAAMYKGPILKALKKAYPGHRKYLIQEDNDPAGFKCNKGIAAKDEAGINTLAVPKHSPDLNLCDYALWHEVNRRMRLCEQTWADDKVETRQQYLKRLRRTALRLPKDFISKSTANMKTRCQRLIDAKGWHFEEGGGGRA